MSFVHNFHNNKCTSALQYTLHFHGITTPQTTPRKILTTDQLPEAVHEAAETIYAILQHEYQTEFEATQDGATIEFHITTGNEFDYDSLAFIVASCAAHGVGITYNTDAQTITVQPLLN